MDTVITMAQLGLAAAAVAAFVRAARGPTLADRIVTLDLILLLLAGAVAAHGARAGTELFVPALIVVALVAFAGTIVVARFIEWRDGR